MQGLGLAQVPSDWQQLLADSRPEEPVLKPTVLKTSSPRGLWHWYPVPFHIQNVMVELGDEIGGGERHVLDGNRSV